MAENRMTIAVDAGVADVRLNRPDKMNALDPAMFDAIIAAIADLEQRRDVRAVVLSGEGRGFCAGLDMASMTGGAMGAELEERSHGIANRFQQVAWGWRTLPVPVIAAVHGITFGGGLQIASGADMMIVAPDARLSVMEIKWGIVPDMAGYALWRRRVRDDRLRRLIYTAEEFTGADAVELGFALETAADPRTRAMALAAAIATRNPEAIRAAKRLANLAVESYAGTILVGESDEQARLIGSANQVEAVRANMEKRTPSFADP